MNSYGRIFVIADSRHPASAAVRRGAQLARQCGAELSIALFDHDRAVDHAAQRGSGPREAFVVQRREWLRDRITPFLDPAIDTHIEAVWAPARREAILASVLLEQPDLVIKDIDRESSFAATPLDLQLLHTVPAPLMLVQPSATHLPHRVLAAVDAALDPGHDALNTLILAAARRVAACSEARVDLAHAWRHDPARHGVLESLYETFASEDREAFARFASSHAIPLERRHWLTGSAPHEVLRLAGLMHAELLVIGSIYRTTLEHFALGTTAESLVRHCAQDLLLVKPDGFVEELGRHFDLDGLRQHHLAAA